jgi:hypothetical protein
MRFAMTPVDLGEQVYVKREYSARAYVRFWAGGAHLDAHPTLGASSFYGREASYTLREHDIPTHATPHSVVARYAHRLLTSLASDLWIGDIVSFRVTPCAASSYVEACEWGLAFIHMVFDSCDVAPAARTPDTLRALLDDSRNFRFARALDRTAPVPPSLATLAAHSVPMLDRLATSLADAHAMNFELMLEFVLCPLVNDQVNLWSNFFPAQFMCIDDARAPPPRPGPRFLGTLPYRYITRVHYVTGASVLTILDTPSTNSFQSSECNGSYTTALWAAVGSHAIEASLLRESRSLLDAAQQQFAHCADRPAVLYLQGLAQWAQHGGSLLEAHARVVRALLAEERELGDEDSDMDLVEETDSGTSESDGWLSSGGEEDDEGADEFFASFPRLQSCGSTALSMTH